MEIRSNRRKFLKKSSIFFLSTAGLFRPGKRVLAANNIKPNILLIVSDDHGWGDLPSNGAKTDVKMPAVDGIGKSGIRFSNYYTAPLCGPARAGIMTGQYSMDCGMWRGPGSQP